MQQELHLLLLYLLLCISGCQAADKSALLVVDMQVRCSGQPGTLASKVVHHSVGHSRVGVAWGSCTRHRSTWHNRHQMALQGYLVSDSVTADMYN
jgi:hypothetical protein